VPKMEQNLWYVLRTGLFGSKGVFSLRRFWTNKPFFRSASNRETIFQTEIVLTALMFAL